MAMRSGMSPLRDERGFTIIETMAATFLMAIAFLGLAGVHAVSSRAQSLGKNQGLATFVAAEDIAMMRRTNFDAVASGNSAITVEGVPFTIERAVVDGGTFKRVTATVRWTERLGPREISHTSVVSRVTNP
jgi:Tfp pilus assembly protein PilV